MIVQLPSPDSLAWSAGRSHDGPALAELRALVLRASLERVGRFDEVRVRQRFLASYVPGDTQVLRRADEVVGSLALRTAAAGTWIEHFYLHPSLQGRGSGSAILRAVTSVADATATTLHLDVLRGSDARRLYERHGFALDREEAVDIYLQRPPAS
ncbi:GNAT family N-acetyltransferase [Blastococcus goldschmidtiae]|uniref:GNAT family N-acetyltransferase n=1 Tax=Blastococcus goldschmidtiae TaxID=3075546 RepID=A0ABU2K4Y6_9ACTN|nr:GNAT family N-acetyltransferase [Blastococcus sp. DSM 46792]MDT0275248.1 GNAT family N-acetyltransferase [Blastococcus sp. DSM 46792]